MPSKKVTITIGLSCLAYFILLIFGTLWPFKIQQNNDVDWSGDQRGLEFHRRGMTMKTSLRGLMYTKDYFDVPQEFTKNSKTVTIILSLSPRIQPLNGLGYILAFDDDLEPEKLIIAQWRDALIIRKRIGQTDSYSEIGAAHVFKNGVVSEVSISFSTRGTNIYVDGNLKESHPNFSYKNIKNLFHGRLLIGNSAYGKSPWAGKINQVAIYKGEYTIKDKISGEGGSLSSGYDTIINEDSLLAYYGFEEQTGQFAYNRVYDNNHLYIPPVFTMLKRSYLISPFRDIRYNAGFFFDVFINILLFVPLSVLAAFVFLRITTLNKLYIYILTVLSCTLMSLIIEFIQVFIPQRSSSILDLGLNIIGAILGIFLLRYILLLFPKIKLKPRS